MECRQLNLDLLLSEPNRRSCLGIFIVNGHAQLHGCGKVPHSTAIISAAVSGALLTLREYIQHIEISKPAIQLVSQSVGQSANPPSSPPPRPLTHSLTRLMNHLIPHSLIHLLPRSRTHSFVHSSTHSPTHSLSQSLDILLTHSLTQ